ncbi:MAG: ABC transporter ATP-binding protein [Caldilineaceae bacterium]
MPQSTNPNVILDVRNLSIDYRPLDAAPVQAVREVSFQLRQGEVMGLVGESGCGKTTLMLGLMRLLPAGGRIVTGQVNFMGRDLMQLSEPEMNGVRWKNISMIFQGAMNALNPVHTVGRQIGEALLLHTDVRESAAIDARVLELLDLVGIAASRKDQYPHQYSGGMRQRAMIAMALACNPQVVIADEPTTALDVTIEAQILELLKDLQNEFGMAIMYISHDLAVVGGVADEIIVMYLGLVMEHASAEQLFENPRHPYTQALLRSIPTIDGTLEPGPAKN